MTDRLNDIQRMCKTCHWYDPLERKCLDQFNIYPDFELGLNNSCAFWLRHVCTCGGTLETRYHGNEILQHCFSCNLEFYFPKEGEKE